MGEELIWHALSFATPSQEIRVGFYVHPPVGEDDVSAAAESVEDVLADRDDVPAHDVL